MPKESEEKKPSIDELIIKLEKIDGKLEVVDRFRETTDERTSRLSEQIGELRTMIMERERSSRGMEADFEKIKTLVKEIDPMQLVRESEKKEKKIVETQVKIEKLESSINRLSEEVANFRKVMDKIKSFENLVELSKEVRSKIANIEDSKKYTDRLAAKVEAIFSELNKKLLETEEYKVKIDNMEELTKELVKDLDQVKMKLTDISDRSEKLPTAKEFEDKYVNVVAAVDTLEKKTRILELEKISEDFGRRINELGPDMLELKRLEELSKERVRVTELMESVEEDHKNGLISAESYNEVKKKNQELLVDIKAALSENFLKLEQVLEIEIVKPQEVKATEKLVVETTGITISESNVFEKLPEAPKIFEVAKGEVAGAKEKRTITEEAMGEQLEREVLKTPQVAAVKSAQGRPDRRVLLLETEMVVVQNLLSDLTTSGMDERKRAAMEKKYKERIERLSNDLAALKGGS